MKDKFLKLVLSKSNSRKSILLNKKEGNISSLLAGLMFLMVVIIIVMFNFRVTMLSEVFYNIDDSLTASTLGASTPNADAYMSSTTYPEQGQLILQDAVAGSSAYVNYKQGNVSGVVYNEQRVVMSELNSKFINNGRHDAASLTNASNVKTTSDAAALTRLGFTYGTVTGNEFNSYINYKKSNRKISSTDDYTLKVVNDLLSTTYTNFTQSTVAAPRLSSLNNVSYLKNNFCIGKDSVLNKAFLGNYLNSDINITRLEIYNVFRYTLAKRHVYASPYMTYSVTALDGYTWHGYTWDGYSLNGAASGKPKLNVYNSGDGSEFKASNAIRDMVNATSIGSTFTIDGKSYRNMNGIDIKVTGWQGPTDEEAFKDLMLDLYPAMVVRDRVPDFMEPVVQESDYAMYDMMKALWQYDLAAWNARDTYPLVFWEDTGISCQTSWWASNNDLNKYYGYLWNNNSRGAIKITDKVLTTDSSGRKLLPIEGYSVYSYVRDRGVSTRYNSFCDSEDSSKLELLNKKTSIVLGDYDSNNTVDDKSTSGTVYENRKKNANLYHSGVYMEMAFDVIMFPNNSTDPNTSDSFLNLAEFSTQEVTQGRLVTVTKLD